MWQGSQAKMTKIIAQMWSRSETAWNQDFTMEALTETGNQFQVLKSNKLIARCRFPETKLIKHLETLLTVLLFTSLLSQIVPEKAKAQNCLRVPPITSVQQWNNQQQIKATSTIKDPINVHPRIQQRFILWELVEKRNQSLMGS